MEDYLITVTQEADEVIRLAVGISDAEYWVGEARADLSNEIVVNDEASLYAALSDVADFVQPGDAAHDGFADFVAEEHIDWTIDQGAINIDDANIAETAITQHEAAIDHTGIANVGANTHAQIDTALTRLADTSGINTGDISLDTTSHDYLSLLGQEITLDAIDLTADVTGELPVANVANLSGVNTGDQSAGDFSHGSLADLSTGADHSYIDQDVTAGASPNFDGANITGILASALGGVLEDLDTLGAATADSEFIVATGAGAFTYESGATALASLELSANLANLTDAEVGELENINSVTVNNTQWGYLGALGSAPLEADGSVALTANWDIGDTNKILADEIRARDGAGLKLFEDGGDGIFIDNGGKMVLGGDGTTSPSYDVESKGSFRWNRGQESKAFRFAGQSISNLLEVNATYDEVYFGNITYDTGALFNVDSDGTTGATSHLRVGGKLDTGSDLVSLDLFPSFRNESGATQKTGSVIKIEPSVDNITGGFSEISTIKVIEILDGDSYQYTTDNAYGLYIEKFTNVNSVSAYFGDKVGINNSEPDTILDIDGAFTFREKSADPDDPDEGAAVLWMSDGSGAGSDGDILVKVTASGTTKTATLVDFSEV